MNATTMTAPRTRGRRKVTIKAQDVVRPSPASGADATFADAPTITAAGHTGVDMSPSEKLKKECIGLRLNFNWLTCSRQVDKATKITMATAAESTEDSFSASKRLMDSQHPVVKEANELQRRIKGYVHGATIPVAGFTPGRGKPEPGVRLLEIVKIDEIDTHLRTFIPEVEAMEARLNEAMPDIKAMDKARLKGIYKESDYPKILSLDFSWGFLSVDIPAALEKLAPHIYAREYARLQERMDETYELATATVLGQFLAVIENWVRVLGPVVKIYPREDNPLAAYHGAEIRQRYEAGEHAIKTKVDGENGETVTGVIPAGSVALLVRHYRGNCRKLSESVLGPLTQAEYANLQPGTVTGDKNGFQKGTIEAMTGFLSQFHNVSNTISASDNLKAIVRNVETQIAKMSDTEGVVRELRNSATFRNDTHQLMTQLSERLGSEITTFRESRVRIDRPAARPAN